MAPNTQLFPYVFCDARGEGLAAALTDLQQASVLAVDCEGVSLGRVGSRLTLLQVATPSTTYIFDLQVLGDEFFDLGFRDILADREVTKLFFDCRCDVTAMYTQFNVTRFEGILDLQLADLALRADDEETRLKRLSPFIYRRQVQGNPGLYSCVYRLSGLVGAVSEHQVYAPDLLASIKGCKDTERGRASKSFLHKPSWKARQDDDQDTCKWGLRPLEPKLLEYAAMDARLIWDLHAVLAGRLEGITLEEVRQASQRYVRGAMHPLEPSSIYNCHPLLPLDVYPALLPAQHRHSSRRSCGICHASVTSSLFTTNFKNSHKCPVCKVLHARDASHKAYQRQQDRDFDDCVDDGSERGMFEY